MDKNFRKIFFLICLGGGILFALPFFFGFGAEMGYSWYWALICLGGGLFWALAFYFIWLLVEKFQKPFSFENPFKNPKAQKKLLDYENLREETYVYRLCAYLHYGKGLKQEICEACIHFEKEKINIAFCHFGKIRTLNIPYERVESAFIIDEGDLVINSPETGHLVLFLKDEASQLKQLLIEKGIYQEVSFEATGRLFTTNKERAGTAYFEFQYCKKEGSLKNLVKRGYSFWKDDSVLVNVNNEEIFFQEYFKYLEFPNAPNGTQDFDPYGVNYYTKEQTMSIIERIKEDKPQDFESLVVWLEKAVSEYNGFYFLGI